MLSVNNMQIIPIKYIHQSDKNFVPENVLDIAFIYRQGIPVQNLFYIMAPEKIFESILDKLQIIDFRSFEANEEKINYLLQEKLNTSELLKELSDIDINPQYAFSELSKKWLEQIKLRNFHNSKIPKYAALPIQKNDFVHAEGTIYFDKKTNNAVINITNGSLNVDTEMELIDLIQKIDKKMIPTRIFSWVLTDQFKITDCRNFTEELDTKISLQKIIADESYNSKLKPKISSVNRIFGIKDKGALTIPENIDGFILPSITDSETRLFEIGEYASSLHNKPLLYQINAQSLTDTEIFDLVFLRTNKGFSNIEIIISQFGSKEKLINVLEQFKIAKILHSKLWLELQEVEHVINLKDYLSTGIEKVVLNLDILVSRLIGEQIVDKKFASQTLIKFLENYKEILFNSDIKLLITGGLILDEDIINFFVSNRVVVFGTLTAEISNLREYLVFLEKKLILKKSGESK